MQSSWPPWAGAAISCSSGRNVAGWPGHGTRPRTPTHPVLVHTQVCPEFLPLGYIPGDISSHLPIPFYNQNINDEGMWRTSCTHCEVQRGDSHCFSPSHFLSSIRPTPIPVLSGNKALGKVESWNHSSRQDFAHTLSWASSCREVINYSIAELMNSKYNMCWKGRVTWVLLKTHMYLHREIQWFYSFSKYENKCRKGKSLSHWHRWNSDAWIWNLAIASSQKDLLPPCFPLMWWMGQSAHP